MSIYYKIVILLLFQFHLQTTFHLTSLRYLFNRSTFERELKYLAKVCYEKSSYLKYIVKQIPDKAFKEDNHKNATNTTLDEQNKTEHATEKKHVLVLPYQGKKGDF